MTAKGRAKPSTRALLELEALLVRIHDEARLLPALTPDNAVSERRRLTEELVRGEVPVPRFRVTSRALHNDVWKWLARAQKLAEHVAVSSLFVARLEELELDLCMLAALGDARRVRPLARRRFGTASDVVPTADGPTKLCDVADAILATVETSWEERELPAESLPGEPSLAELIRRVCARAGLEAEVRVEPRLTAAAATGDRTIFIADRKFGTREALRLAIHEVLGHLVSATNARSQPLRLLEIGTAGSFADQEGLALWLEERAGLMDGLRLRTLAARVVASRWTHQGASFGEIARRLAVEHGFCAEDAVALAERAQRGGGVTRDVAYLRGWLCVRSAIAGCTAAEGELGVHDVLRSGRVGVADVSILRSLADGGLYRPPTFRPSLAYSLSATEAGTSSFTSPPSVAASFTMLEET